MESIETRYGVLSVPNSGQDTIGRFLARYGEWGWDEVLFLSSVLDDGPTRVLDLGAYVGTFGIGLASAKQLDFVCFVEANGEISPYLAENVNRNCKAPSLVVEALVIGSQAHASEGRFEPANFGSTSFAGKPEAGDQRQGVVPLPVRKLTLAELRSEHGPFDLIKLDIEGMELDVLEPDADHLAQAGTTLWIECNESPRSVEIVRYLLSLHLDIFYFAFPSHNPDNFRGDPVPIYPFAYEAGLLAAPKRLPALNDPLASHHCILRNISNADQLKEALWRTPRWGLADWHGTSVEELAALAGRALRGESFRQFLGANWSRSGAPLDVMRGELRKEQARAERAESALAEASARLLDRASEIGAERERAERAEAGVSELRQRIAEAAGRCAVIEASIGWRAERALRRLVGAQPQPVKPKLGD